MKINGESKFLKPVSLKVVDKKCVSLNLYEGKYHQVKKMFLSCGNKVISLERTMIGNLSLENLKSGEWKDNYVFLSYPKMER